MGSTEQLLGVPTCGWPEKLVFSLPGFGDGAAEAFGSLVRPLDANNHVRKPTGRLTPFISRCPQIQWNLINSL